MPAALSAEDLFRFHGRYANGELIAARTRQVKVARSTVVTDKAGQSFVTGNRQCVQRLPVSLFVFDAGEEFIFVSQRLADTNEGLRRDLASATDAAVLIRERHTESPFETFQTGGKIFGEHDVGDVPNASKRLRDVEGCGEHPELGLQVLPGNPVEKIIERVSKPSSFGGQAGVVDRFLDIPAKHPVVREHSRDGIPKAGEREGFGGEMQPPDRRVRKSVKVVAFHDQIRIPADVAIAPPFAAVGRPFPEFAIGGIGIRRTDAEEDVVEGCAAGFAEMNVIDAFMAGSEPERDMRPVRRPGEQPEAAQKPAGSVPETGHPPRPKGEVSPTTREWFHRCRPGSSSTGLIASTINDV